MGVVIGMSAGPLPDWRNNRTSPFDLTLIDVMIEQVRLPLS